MYEKLNLGSIGFAQLGSKDYYEKRIIEKRVMRELLNTASFENKFPELCSIQIVREPYEDSSYDEIAIVYNYQKVHNLEDSDEYKH